MLKIIVYKSDLFLHVNVSTKNGTAPETLPTEKVKSHATQISFKS